MARILLVEDDKVTGQFLEDVILKYAERDYKSDWPIKVTRAGNGIQALKLLEEHNYELVVTDILMASMDGWEMIREIRKVRNQSDLPIFVVSAVDAVDLRYNSAKYGASGWMTKPVKPAEFANKVFELLGDR